MEAANQYSYAKVEYESQKQASNSLQSFISNQQLSKSQLAANNSQLEAQVKQLRSGAQQSKEKSDTLRSEHMACCIKSQRITDDLDKSKKTNDLLKIYEDSGELANKKLDDSTANNSSSFLSQYLTKNVSISYDDACLTNRIYEKLILQDPSYKNELDRLRDVNFINNGKTILIHALQLQNIKAVDAILVRNPDVNIINQEDGAIALNYSTLLPVNEFSTYEINQYILKNTSNVNHKAESFLNNTAMHNLAENLLRVSKSPDEEESKESLTDLIGCFIEFGAEIDIENSNGTTVRELLANNDLLNSIDGF